MENKKNSSFSLDPTIQEFIAETHWDYKVSKSAFINTILQYLKNNSELLELIFDQQPEIATPVKTTESIFDL